MENTPPRPLGANVIIMNLDNAEQIQTDIGNIGGTLTPGGIIIPHAVKNNRRSDSVGRGLVLAVGDKVEEVEGGEEVFYNVHAAKEMEVEGQMYLVLSIYEILAIIGNDTTGSEGTGS